MYKVIDTTDNKFEGIEIESLPSVGDVFHFGDIEFKVDSIKENGNTVTIICSNYIAVLEKIS